MKHLFLRHSRTFALFIIATLLPGLVRAADTGKPVANVKLPDADGKLHALHDLKNKKAIVAVFLSFECPVSNSYSSLLAAMHAKYSPLGVAFVGIDSNDELTAAEVANRLDTSATAK